MSQLTIRGSVSLEGGEFPIAGVTVVAAIPSDDETEERSSHQPVRMQIARVVTDSDGSFTIEPDGDDPRTSRWVCVLRNCDEFKFRLTCLDRDETMLHESEPLSYADGLSIQIALREPESAPSREDWHEFSHRMLQSQTVRIGDVATELAACTPRGV